jgi:hypothetical protein
MQEFTQSERGRSVLLYDVLVFLRNSLSQGLHQAAHELLQQGLVLLCLLSRCCVETLLRSC